MVMFIRAVGVAIGLCALGISVNFVVNHTKLFAGNDNHFIGIVNF